MRLKGPNGIVHAKPVPCSKGGDYVEYQEADGHYRDALYALDGNVLWLSHNGFTARFTLVEGISAAAGKEALAPMTGKVVAIPVEVGQTVKQGDTLAILEAMKMEYRLEAEADGEVAEIGVQVGELVDLGHVLVRLK